MNYWLILNIFLTTGLCHGITNKFAESSHHYGKLRKYPADYKSTNGTATGTTWKHLEYENIPKGVGSYATRIRSDSGTTSNGTSVPNPVYRGRTYTLPKDTNTNKVKSTEIKNYNFPTAIKESAPKLPKSQNFQGALKESNPIQTKFDQTIYKAGSISDLISRQQSLPINNFKSHSNLRKYPPSPESEIVSITYSNEDLQHPAIPTNNKTKFPFQNYKTPSPSPVPVTAAIHTQIVHEKPADSNTISDRLLIGLSPFLPPRRYPSSLTSPHYYNQSIVHLNEPKYLPNPSSFNPRKQRNLRRISQDNEDDDGDDDDDGVKLIEREDHHLYHQNTEDNNDAEEGKDNEKKGANNNDNDDEDEHHNEGHGATDAKAAVTTMLPSQDKSSPLAPKHEMRYLHDIFINYPKSHQANYGHVQLTPELFEKRFESTKGANRYKGEVLWMDNKGGYAQHSWNLALGKL